MKALKDFKGSWNSHLQCIQFSWDAKAIGTDGYIVIAAVMGSGASAKIDISSYKVLELRTLQGTGNMYNMKTTVGRSGVYKMVFCGVSVPSTRDIQDNELLEICRTDPGSLTSVIMGRAEITWSANTATQDDFKLVTIELTSNCEIAAGVLGYQYQYGSDLIVKMPFPGPIHQGKQGGYGPILIPRSCDISVVPYDSQFNGNFTINYKKKFFGF